MSKLNYILILVAVTLNVCVAQNKWIWSKANLNQKAANYYPWTDGNENRAEKQYARADRDREPTTKRPIPGQAQIDDDIDDYTDTNDQIDKQNTPYIPRGAAAGHPRFLGSYNGFANYPQVPGFPGNSPNGILVGPGGPTGIIGRPQFQYPAGVAPSALPGPHAAYPGYPVTQHFPGAPVNNNTGFAGFNGIGQYPYANANNPQQFTGSQYPQNQFPGNGGAQYPQQPQYTEGYGLANLNPGFNFNSQLFNGNFNPNYGFGFDDYPEQVEGKSALIKTVDKNVDDKVTKNLKTSS